ncbi:ribosomal protein L7Ae domain-containing protein [Cryptosporidium muris RN66]|uniref:Ribosomal protein L7Ae domain-containing protein n=1 Tax=Cryptosporidium muris (strain RN66) TaxID=441375 RepID=B6AG12_CRYMR|nr:ribosomal protein L7Ae domain-containing protein [Cryptosporidium muris RN66]EEA07153.1 ribosomal protein L7Ae domain-containing protein [Cryptosporidium muris RN66]|eukprot:XP_002141502.1 ribosomal protein L7Ae domain-containing protein [Cryptosporidium muris RN66]
MSDRKSGSLSSNRRLQRTMSSFRNNQDCGLINNDFASFELNSNDLYRSDNAHCSVSNSLSSITDTRNRDYIPEEFNSFGMGKNNSHNGLGVGHVKSSIAQDISNGDNIFHSSGSGSLLWDRQSDIPLVLEQFSSKSAFEIHEDQDPRPKSMNYSVDNLGDRSLCSWDYSNYTSGSLFSSYPADRNISLEPRVYKDKFDYGVHNWMENNDNSSNEDTKNKDSAFYWSNGNHQIEQSYEIRGIGRLTQREYEDSSREIRIRNEAYMSGNQYFRQRNYNIVHGCDYDKTNTKGTKYSGDKLSSTAFTEDNLKSRNIGDMATSPLNDYSVFNRNRFYMSEAERDLNAQGFISDMTPLGSNTPITRQLQMSGFNRDLYSQFNYFTNDEYIKINQFNSRSVFADSPQSSSTSDAILNIQRDGFGSNINNKTIIQQGEMNNFTKKSGVGNFSVDNIATLDNNKSIYPLMGHFPLKSALPTGEYLSDYINHYQQPSTINKGNNVNFQHYAPHWRSVDIEANDSFNKNKRNLAFTCKGSEQTSISIQNSKILLPIKVSSRGSSNSRFPPPPPPVPSVGMWRSQFNNTSLYSNAATCKNLPVSSLQQFRQQQSAYYSNSLSVSNTHKKNPNSMKIGYQCSTNYSLNSKQNSSTIPLPLPEIYNKIELNSSVSPKIAKKRSNSNQSQNLRKDGVLPNDNSVSANKVGGLNGNRSIVSPTAVSINNGLNLPKVLPSGDDSNLILSQSTTPSTIAALWAKAMSKTGGRNSFNNRFQKSNSGSSAFNTENNETGAYETEIITCARYSSFLRNNSGRLHWLRVMYHYLDTVEISEIRNQNRGNKAIRMVAMDDIAIEAISRSFDPSECAYWSEPENGAFAHKNIRLALAHKVGHRTVANPQNYVTQILTASLDRAVSTLLNTLRAIDDRVRWMSSGVSSKGGTIPGGASSINNKIIGGDTIAENTSRQHSARGLSFGGESASVNHGNNTNSAFPGRVFTVGVREAMRCLRHKKLQALIVAPDIEGGDIEGGLRHHVIHILMQAQEFNIPVIFALNRHRIGRAMGKHMRMSVLGLLSTRGVERQFQTVAHTAKVLQRLYNFCIEHGLQPNEDTFKKLSISINNYSN